MYFSMSSEGFLEWALWRHNISIGYVPGWMHCKFANATVRTARSCVPRMRRRERCRSLVCSSQHADCQCQQSAACSPRALYCEETGAQLDLNGTLYGPGLGRGSSKADV